MLTADDVRAVQFQRTMGGGYKAADVDVFLEEVAAAMETLLRERTEYENKVRTLNRKIDEYKESEGSIHTALLSAQRLADQTVKEAGESAGRMTSEANRKAQQTVEQAENEAAALRKAAEEEITARMNDAIAKSESIISAAHDSVARQQLLFDKLKAEAASFKNLMAPKFEELMTLMQQLPAEVPFGPERAAEALSFAYDKLPDYEEMAVAAKQSQAPAPAAQPEPTPAAQPAAPAAPAAPAVTRPAAPAAPAAANPSASRAAAQSAGAPKAPAAQPAAPAAPARQANAAAPAAASAGVQRPAKKRPALQKEEIGVVGGADVPEKPARRSAPAQVQNTAPQKGGFKIMVEDDDDEDLIGGLFEDDYEEEKPRRGLFRKKK